VLADTAQETDEEQSDDEYDTNMARVHLYINDKVSSKAVAWLALVLHLTFW